MRSKINNFTAALTLVTFMTTQHAWAFCPPPATPQNCAGIAFCSTMSEETRAMKDVDTGFIKKLRDVAKKIFQAFDDMDQRIAGSIMVLSSVGQHSTDDAAKKLVKSMEVQLAFKQKMKMEQKTLEALQLATPGKLFQQQTGLKLYTTSSEFLTRAQRQRLYSDQTQRMNLQPDVFYRDKGNNSNKFSYSQGAIPGMAKLYQTHRLFFCNEKGANKPAGCGDDAAHQNVKMGDQMMEIYLGEGTWPTVQVHRAIELMQYYLGMSPPDLPNTDDFSSGEGQREFLEYEGNVARNNFLTYVLSYLAAKRAPTNKAQMTVTTLRKTMANCATITDDNRQLCAMYDKTMKESKSDSSQAELNSMLFYNRLMNSTYMKDAVGDTLGLEKDMTVMIADRLQQDYEDYQMDKMMTAMLAGYYASIVKGN